MFTLIQFNINDQSEQRMTGTSQEMRREMRSALAWADDNMVPFHALLLNPQGQVVATA